MCNMLYFGTICEWHFLLLLSNAVIYKFAPFSEDEKKDSRGTKRKKGVSDEKPTAKAPKLEETSSQKVDASKSGLSDLDLEKKLKEQSELLWSIKDELKKNVSTAEMREMLEENDQGSSGSEYDLRDRW